MNHKSKYYSEWLTKKLTKLKLYELYIIKKWSITNIAHYFLCSNFPISKALKKYGIRTRNSGQATRQYEEILTKKILIYEYYKNNLSLKEIADKYGISCSKVVLTYFRIYNIPRRTSGLATKIRFNKLDMKEKLSKSHSGKKHWNFKNWSSKKPYTKEWTLELKKFIRERDNYTCAICKKPGNEVHHINYNKKESFPYNLIILCHSCHTKTSNGNRLFYELMLNEILQIRGIK
jgi:predicted DNA-binding protein YlxM (UPF0122 family)